ncbi:hypothetical protein SAMN02745216_05140, partial [Desulfatibacillum alkenivorans DSM 16219]
IVLEATNNITVENLSDDTLSLQTTGAKSLTMTADADNDGGGAITFIGAPGDTVVTQGGDMFFNAGDGMTLAKLDTNGGDVTATINNAGTGTGNLDIYGITTDGGDVNMTNSHGIAGTAVGNLLVRGDIDTSNATVTGGDVNLSATNDLTQIEGATIVTGGGNVTMSADSDGDASGVLTISGKAGVDNIDTRAVGGLADGDAEVSAAQFVMGTGFIQLGTGTMTILSSSQGTIGVGSGAGALNIAGAALQRINADTIEIGSLAGGAVNVDSTANLSGQNIEVYSSTDITVGDIRLGATGVATLESASGAVVDDGGVGGGGTYIQAGSLNITANSVGGSGTGNAALDIDIASGANRVNVTAATGGIYLRDVGTGNAALSNFNLATSSGSQTVSITAASGSILANSAAFDTNIGDDNIYLTTENGTAAKDIVFTQAVETTGDVYLKSVGDVHDSGLLAMVSADYLEIDAVDGVGAGSTGAGPFNVNVNSLKAASENAIYIREDDDVTVEGLETTANTAEIFLTANGNIVLNGDVSADNSGDVTLDAVTGAISRTSGAIYGGLLTISAADGIGATGATGLAIHTDVATLVADNSNTGDIVILEANNLDVGGSTGLQTVTNNSGDIIITSTSGSLNVVQDVTAGSGGDGDVVLTTETLAQTVTIGSGVTVEGGAGGIGGVIIHSDDITLNTGATLIGNGGTGYDTGGDVKLYPWDQSLVINLNGPGNVNFVTTPIATNLADFVTVNNNGFLVIGDEAHSGNINVAGTSAAAFTGGTNVAVVTGGSVSLNLAGSGDISTAGDVHIYAGDRIVDGVADGVADILADDLYLFAGSGIGTAASATGAIDIVATDIYATNSTSNGVFLNILGGTGALGSGAVNVQEAHANTAGQVWIQSTAAGGLTLTDVDTENGAITVDENSGSVTMVAVDGNTVAGANTVSIEGQGNVSLAGTANSHVYSAGNVNLTSISGDIVSGGNTGIEIKGANAVFSASGSIGASGNVLRTQIADLDASAGVGEIRVVEADGLNLSDVDTQTGGIFITSTTGNISIDDVQSDVNVAGNADINIIASSGSVVFNAGGTIIGDDYVYIRASENLVSDGATGVNDEITAPGVALYVSGNIGGSGLDVLEIDANLLEVRIANDSNGASSNAAYIVDSDDLQLGGLIGGIMTGVVAIAAGDVTLDISAAGSLTVVDDVNGVKADATSGDATIKLTAGTDLSAADTILATTTGTGSFDASVTLTAGDNLTTTAAGTVTADVNGGSNSGNATVTIDGNGTGLDRVVVGGNVTASASSGAVTIDINAEGTGNGGPATAALRVQGDLSATTSGSGAVNVTLDVNDAAGTAGSAYVDGNITGSGSGSGTVWIQTTQGSINLLGDITGNFGSTGTVTLDTQFGIAADINLNGSVTISSSGDSAIVVANAGRNVAMGNTAAITVNGGSGSTANNYVDIDAGGSFTMGNSASITLNGGSGSSAQNYVFIDASNAILNGTADVTLGGSGSRNEIRVSALNNVTFNGTSTLDMTASTADTNIVRVWASNGAILMADGAVIDAGASGYIDLNASGNITIGRLVSGLSGTTVATIDAGGAIIDAGDVGGEDIDVNGAGAVTEINAGSSIGTTGGGEIETRIDTLYASGSVVAVIETDDIILGDTQAVAVPDSGIIRATAGTGTAVDITASGDIFAYNIDATGGAGNADISLTSNTGDVTVGSITAGLAGGDVNITANQNIFDDGDGGAFATYTEIDAGGSVNLTATNGHIGWTSSLDIFNTPANIWKAVDIDSGPVLNLNSNGNIQIFNDGSIAALAAVPNGGQSGYEILIGAWGDITVSGALDTLQDNLALVALNGGNITLNAAAGASTGNVELYAEGDIVDGNGTAAADVFAGNGATGGSITLTAGGGGTGSIGSAAAGGAIDLDGDVVNAKSDGSGGIYLNDVVNTGGLDVSADSQGSGNIVITGAVEDLTLVDVKTFDGDIDVTLGGGFDVIVTSVQSDYDGATTGSHDITIQATTGSIYFGTAGAMISDDDVFLTASGGNIHADAANAGPIITADYAYLVARDSIADSAQNELNVSINSVEGQFGSDNGTADIFALYNDKALTVGGTAGTGIFVGGTAGSYNGPLATLTLGANGTITINESIDVRNQGALTDVAVYTDAGDILINAGAANTLIQGSAADTATMTVVAAGNVVLTGATGDAGILLGAAGSGGDADLTVTATGGGITVDGDSGLAYIQAKAGSALGSGSTVTMDINASGGDLNVLAGSGSAYIRSYNYGDTATNTMTVDAANILIDGESGSLAEIWAYGSGGSNGTVSLTVNAGGTIDLLAGTGTADVWLGAEQNATDSTITMDVTAGGSITVDQETSTGTAYLGAYGEVLDVDAITVNVTSTNGDITVNGSNGSIAADGSGGDTNANLTLTANNGIVLVDNSGAIFAEAGSGGTGVPGTTGAHLIINANAVTVDRSGDIYASGGPGFKDIVDINAGGAVLVNRGGEIRAASQTGSVTINAASVVVGSGSTGSSVAATGSVNAFVSITTTGSAGITVGSSGSVTADATGPGAVLSKIVLNAGTDAAADVTIDGKVQAGDALTGTGAATVDIDAADAVTMGSSGRILAYAGGSNLGSIDIDANGNVDLYGTVTARSTSGNAYVNVDSVTGNIAAGSSGVGITADAGSGAGDVADINLNAASGLVTVDGALAATGTTAYVDIDANTSVTITSSGSIYADGGAKGSVDINAGTTVSISDTIKADGSNTADINIIAGGDVTLNDLGSGLMTTGSIATITIDATGNVSLNEDVDANGAAFGSISVTADGATGITILGGPENGITAGSGGTANVILNATVGAVTISDTVSATAAIAVIDIDAATNVTLNDSGNGLRANGSGVGSININAGGDVTLSEDVYADGSNADVYVRADGATGITINNTMETGLRAISAGGPADIVLDTQADADVDGGVYIYDNVIAQGTTVAVVDINSDDVVTMNATGTIQASTTNLTGSIDIDAVGTVSLDNKVFATSTSGDALVNVDSTGGNITLGANGTGIKADAGSGAGDTATVYLNAGGSVDLSNTVEAEGRHSDIDILAGADITLNGTGSGIVADAIAIGFANILIDASGDVTLNNDVEADGSGTIININADGSTGISLGAGKQILGSANNSASTITLQSTDGSSVVNIDGTITATSVGHFANVNIGTSGTSVAGGIDIDGAITVNGDHTGSTYAGLWAAGDISVDAAIAVTDTEGDATIKLDAGSSVTLDAAGNLTATADNGDTARVTILAGSNVTIDTQVTADALSDTGANAYVTIGTPGSAIGGTVTLQANADVLAEADTGEAVVNIDAVGTVTVDGSLQATSSGDKAVITVDTAGDIDVNPGAVIAGTGADTGDSSLVSLVASGDIYIEAPVSIEDSVGDATLTVNSLGGSVTADGSGNLTAIGGSSDDPVIEIFADANVSIDTQIYADGITYDGYSAYVYIGSSGNRIGGTVTLGSNADVKAYAGTDTAEVYIHSSGDITVDGAVTIKADAGQTAGGSDDAGIYIRSYTGAVTINGGAGSIKAVAGDALASSGQAIVNIQADTDVTVNNDVYAQAYARTAEVEILAGGDVTVDALLQSTVTAGTGRSAIVNIGTNGVPVAGTITLNSNADIQAVSGGNAAAQGIVGMYANGDISVHGGVGILADSDTNNGSDATITIRSNAGGVAIGSGGGSILADGDDNATVTIAGLGGLASQVSIGNDVTADAESGVGSINIDANGTGSSALVIIGDLSAQATTRATVDIDSNGAGGDVTIGGSIDALSTGASADVFINSTGGDITQNAGAVITGSATADVDIVIDTGSSAGDVTLNAAILANAPAGSIYIRGGNDVKFNAAAADITVNGGAGTGDAPVTVTATNGSITMNAGAVIDAGSGQIKMIADDNIILGRVITSETGAVGGDVIMTAANGAITDAGLADIDITAINGSAVLTAASGIGAVGNVIETRIATLNASVTGTGGIYVTEYDGIDLVDVDTVEGDIVIIGGNAAAGNVTATDVAATTAGDISITNSATGDILVGVVQTASGDIALTADTGAINEIGAGDVGVDIITANGLLDMYATGGIGTAAGGLETTVNTLYATGSSVIINETDDIILGDEQDVAIPGTGKVRATSATGSIDIEAGGDIFANYVVAATGTATTVNIDSNGGSITLGDVSGFDVTINANKNVLDDGDGGSAAAPSVIPFYTQVEAGNNLTINAGSAGSGYYIGTNTPIDPRTGSIYLAVDAKWANVGSFNSTDNIQIYQTGDVTIAAAPNFNSGGGSGDQILHMAEDNYTVNAGFVVGGGDNVWLAALNGNLTIAAAQTVQASSGSVDLYARNGNVVLSGAIAASGNAQVEATNQIIDGGADATVDITVASGVVTLKAANGIGTGSSAAAAIDIIACTIDATNTTANGIFINSLGGSAANSGSVEIRTAYAQTAGNVWINGQTDLYLTDVQAADDVDVTTGGDAGDDIFVEYVQAGGAIGDDITLTAGSGSILEVTADAAVDIVSAGGLLTLTAANNIGGGGEADIETTVAGINASSTTSGDIYITESDGVTLTDVDTASGNVVIVAGATGSGLMIATDVIAATAGGAGDGDVTLTNSSGGIQLGSVRATNDRVTLDASTFISDGDGLDYNDVIADELVMTAKTTIGAVGVNGALDVQISNLEAYAGDTGVAGPTEVSLMNLGALTIGGITLGMSGVQAISTNGTGAATAAATINILANDLTVNEAVKAQGTDAYINLNASTGSISTSATGDISAIGGATAFVLLNANLGIDTLGTIIGSATGDVDVGLTAHGTGNLDVGAAVTANASGAAGDSYMRLSTQTGSIVTQAAGTLTGSGDHARIDIDSGTGVGGPVVGDITINGAIDLNAVSSGSVDIRTNLSGDIDIEAPISADATSGWVGVYAKADQGSVLTNAAISAAGTSNAVVDLQGQTTLTVNQAISAIGANGFSIVDLDAVTGNLTTGVNGDITASGGTTVTVGLTAGGNIQTNGSIDADAGTGLADLSMTAAGSIDVNDAIAVTSTSGNVDIDLDANGGPIDTAAGANIVGTTTNSDGNNDVDINLDAVGSITTNGSIDANGADDARVTLTATTGITVNDNIDATGTAGSANVDLNANGGNIATALAGSINATGQTTVDVT